MGVIIAQINKMDSKYSQTVRAPERRRTPLLQSPINAKKGEAARPPPSSSLAYGSVPSTGQRRPGLPRAGPAVLSARWGLASGFGTGPGVPPMLWPLTGGRRPPLRCPVSHTRALGAAWRIGETTRGHPRARTARMSAGSRGPRGAVPEELGRLVRLG